MKSTRLLQTFLVVLLLSVTSIAQPSIPSLLNELDSIIAKENIPGAMISIVRSDSIIFTGGVGFANLEKKEPVTDQHLFRLGSISKTFTAIGILKLVERGAFNLTTPVKDIDSNIPFKNNWSEKSPVTVEQILEHTAGFDDMHMHALYNNTHTTAPSTSELLDIQRKSLYARWKPGTRMAYSNPGYVVAGHLIEQQSKQPYHQYLKEQILIPLGMKASGFYFKRPKSKWMTHGYDYEGRQFQQVDYRSIQGGPAGAFCSNAKEMALFLQFMLKRQTTEGNTIISTTSFDRMETAKTSIAAKAGFPIGYGLGNSQKIRNGYSFHGHDGGIDGFRSEYLYSSEADLGIAVSMNVAKNPRNLIQPILDHFIKNKRTTNRTEVSIAPEVVQEYEAYYTYKSPRNQVFAFAQQMVDGVSLKFIDDKSIEVTNYFGKVEDTLYHAGNNQFYSGKKSSAPFAMFLKNEKREPVMWLANSYAEQESKVWRTVKNIMIWFSMLIAFPFLFYGLIWLIIQLVSKTKKPIQSRLVTWFASISYVLIPVSFILAAEFSVGDDLTMIFQKILFMSSISFFLFSVFSLRYFFSLEKESSFFRFYYRLTSLCLSGLAIYFLMNGIVGFRMWAY